ncbi:uncharacterized protein KY384_000412 [Bacidia gigantensis]|uniref:uncharacterized protein n=1 Tax=Bacidia gigantensis TaxID=2732470 RepID=UPI001D04F008|nr:uncharacterized protein KY384_000412 [Bacidia gigantensis]KAG8525652.1 hypothetical protein KY384_000412 [Bacidia gigantensis]
MKGSKLQAPETPPPPPPYEAHARPDLNAAFSRLNLQAKTSRPSPDECLAHLKLLEAFHRLRQSIAFGSGLFGIKDDGPDWQLAQRREKRWAVYVARAAYRFGRWWSQCDLQGGRQLTMGDLSALSQESLVKGSTLHFDHNNIPPLDVILVWHAYQLNPRNFLEDCLRYGKTTLWRSGLPWSIIDACINNSTFAFNAPERAKDWFKKTTGQCWDNLDNPNSTLVTCASRACMQSNLVPWTTSDVDGSPQVGDGVADKNFRHTCVQCYLIMDNDTLRLRKLRDDIVALKSSNVPLPGTILNRDGTPAIPTKVHEPRALYPNKFIMTKRPASTTLHGQQVSLPSLYDDLLGAIEHTISTCGSFSIVRDEIQKHLPKDLHRDERVAVRKMMSNYWTNSSPFSIDLIGAVIRQGSFIDKMHNFDWLHAPSAPSVLNRFIAKYERFIWITKLSAKTSNRVAVPTLDVDLVWHTHQLSPPSYYTYTLAQTSKFIDHDDKIASTKLSTSFKWTSEIYQKKFGDTYSECLCWYCQATREQHTSSVRRLFGAPSRPTTTTSDMDGVHISAHSSITADTTIAHATREAKVSADLAKAYEKVAQRARKRGEEPPPRPSKQENQSVMAWDVPLYLTYAPYMPDPYSPQQNDHPIAISVHHPNGADLTQNISIYHLPQPHHGALTKRMGAIITCDTARNGKEYRTIASRCVRPSVQPWTCTAAATSDTQFPVDDITDDISDQIVSDGACNADQICVDGIQAPGYLYNMAYCLAVDTANKIAATVDRAQFAGQGRVAAYLSSSKSGGLKAVEAVFSGKDITDPITLKSLRVEGQKNTYSGAFATRWQTVQSNTCQQCTSLGLQPVQDSVSALRVYAEFPDAFEGATMFVNSL